MNMQDAYNKWSEHYDTNIYRPRDLPAFCGVGKVQMGYGFLNFT